MTTDRSNYNVLIASYLEPEHVERIRSVDARLNVMYEPELLRPPRYPADHKGRDVSRSPDQETRWLQLLRDADILFDFDQTHREDLPELAPRVQWLQATSAGGLDRADLPQVPADAGLCRCQALGPERIHERPLRSGRAVLQ